MSSPTRSRRWTTGWLWLVLAVSGHPLAETVHASLDAALADAATRLTLSAGLSGQPLFINPDDFHELRTERTLPLARVLRERLVAEFTARGVRVMLPGADDDRLDVLQGQWQKEGARLSLIFKVMRLTPDGPQATIGYTTQVRYDAIAPELLEPDMASWGRDLVRRLENQVSDHASRSVHLKPLEVHGDTARPRELGEYLRDSLRPALARSHLFRPIDAPRVLARLDNRALQTRGMGIEMKAPEVMSLTADLLRADAEMGGAAYLTPEQVEVQLYVRDRSGRQLAAAAARVGKDQVPDRLVRSEVPEAPVAPRAQANGGLSLNGLVLDLATTRGDGKAVYRDGEYIQFVVRTNRSAHLYLILEDSAGKVTLLYPIPGVRVPPLDAGRPLILPDQGLPYRIKVEPPHGEDYVWAVAAQTPLKMPRGNDALWADFERLRDHIRATGLARRDGYAEADVTVVTRAAKGQ